MERAEELFERIAKDGETAIDELIRDRAAEELFLDFVTSSDNGTGNRFNEADRNNLANAISGFANSEGGVIVWGVYCKEGTDNADVARSKKPITNPTRFRSWIERTISGCTIPVLSGVRNAVVQRPNRDEGFVITYVPKSNSAPHQTVQSKKYLIRAGSSFVPTPHQVLAGMFGRRPQPEVYLMFNVEPPQISQGRIEASLGLVLRNAGPGIAKDLFLNAAIWGQPGENCRFILTINPNDVSRWSAYRSFGCHVSMMGNPDLRLPPDAQLSPMTLRASLFPPFEHDLRVDISVGAANAPSFRMSSRTPAQTLAAIYRDYLQGNLTEADRGKFLARVFSLPDLSSANANETVLNG